MPEGLETEMITPSLEICVRGPKDVMATFRAADITVTVDFADADIGTAKMKAEVSIQNEKYSDIGVVGTYVVSAVLREPIPEETIDPLTETNQLNVG